MYTFGGSGDRLLYMVYLQFSSSGPPAGENVGTIQGKEARQGLRAADTAVLMLLRLLVSRAALRRRSDGAAASQSGSPAAAQEGIDVRRVVIFIFESNHLMN